MIAIISNAIAKVFSFLGNFQVKRFLAIAVIGVLILGADVNPDRSSRPLSEKVNNRVEQANQRSERPKTTGEFLDEARGDVPLGERIHNITRDSVEAFQDLGDQYGDAAKESARGAKNAVEKAGDKVSDIRR
jgi:hypothetical protein